MCITTQASELPETYVGAWDIDHPQYGYRHVLAYQNVPVNLSAQPNCMLLHIPSAQPLQAEDLLDTSDCPWLLKQMAESGRKERSRALFAPANHIFEMGVYHIAMLNDVRMDAVQASLQQIPEHKRPNISIDFIQFFASYFPGFPLLLCCFNNQESQKASPIIVHYAPKRPDVFQLNLLDGHGHLPDIRAHLHFHRTLVVGSYKINHTSEEARPFDLSKVPKHLLPFLPQYGFTEDLHTHLPNADLLISVDDVVNSRRAKVAVDLLPEFVEF